MSFYKLSSVGLLTLCCAAPGMAAPYQFEAGALFLTGDAELGPDSADLETLAFMGTYYLKPVDQDSGPLALRAFLGTAASVTLGYDQSELGSIETDTLSLEARLVSAADMIGIVEVDQVDSGGDDAVNYVLGIGTYLDPKTEVLATLGFDDDAIDTKTYRLEYHKLLDGSAAGTYIDFTAAISYIDSDLDSGNGFEIGGTYYPSEILGVSASFEKEDDGRRETQNILIGGEYFLSETLAIGAAFAMGENGAIDTDGLVFSVKGRF